MGILVPWNAQVGYFFPVNIIQLVDEALTKTKELVEKVPQRKFNSGAMPCSFCFIQGCNCECSGDGAMGD